MEVIANFHEKNLRQIKQLGDLNKKSTPVVFKFSSAAAHFFHAAKLRSAPLTKPAAIKGCREWSQIDALEIFSTDFLDTYFPDTPGNLPRHTWVPGHATDLSYCDGLRPKSGCLVLRNTSV